MPDSMMEGKNTNWLNMVSFAWLLMDNPKTQAMLSDTRIKTITFPK